MRTSTDLLTAFQSGGAGRHFKRHLTPRRRQIGVTFQVDDENVRALHVVAYNNGEQWHTAQQLMQDSSPSNV